MKDKPERRFLMRTNMKSWLCGKIDVLGQHEIIITFLNVIPVSQWQCIVTTLHGGKQIVTITVDFRQGMESVSLL